MEEAIRDQVDSGYGGGNCAIHALLEALGQPEIEEPEEEESESELEQRHDQVLATATTNLRTRIATYLQRLDDGDQNLNAWAAAGRGGIPGLINRIQTGTYAFMITFYVYIYSYIIIIIDGWALGEQELVAAAAALSVNLRIIGTRNGQHAPGHTYSYPHPAADATTEWINLELQMPEQAEQNIGHYRAATPVPLLMCVLMICTADV